MKYNCNDEETIERCGTTKNMKDNCETEPGEEIEVNCGSISDAVCVGILVDKVYDCATGQPCPQYTNKDEEFTIMGNSSCKKDRYEEGAPICIDSIGLCYDYIGLQDEVPSVEGGQIAVKYDALPKLFTSVEGTEFNHPNGETLYTEFEGSVSKTPCSFRSNNSDDDEAVKRTVFKGNIPFHAANLKVMISGRIGCKKFTATKEYDDIVEITKSDEEGGLNFSPASLYTRVSSPNDGRIVKSNIKFDSCLAVECVTTDQLYSEENEGIIRANVNYSFVTSGRVRHTTNEEIAVFTNPNGVEYRESDNDSSCL